MRWTVLSLALLSGSISLAGGCGGSSESTSSACQPGTLRECACPGGTVSTQRCVDGGLNWGPCECGDGSADNGSGGAGGEREDGTGAVAGTPVTGAGGTGGDDCPDGTERCACYGNGTCNAGLVCASNLCVRLGSGGTTGAGGSATGGTAGAMGGCGPDEFRCASGECVDVSRVCDGLTADCQDGSDESPSLCSGSGGTGGVTAGAGGNSAGGTAGAATGCAADEFACGFMECIATALVCDGTPHCADSADEDPSTCGAAGGGAGGSVGSSGGGTGVGGSTTVQPHPGDSGIIPDDGGCFVMDWNQSGVIGGWYVYQDTGGSSIAGDYLDPRSYCPFGNETGELCFSGTASGHQDINWSTNWGAGLGLDVCAMPADMSMLPADLQAAGSPEQKFQAGSCPTVLTGVGSLTFTITGSWGPEMRVGFKESDSQDVAPFFIISEAGTYTIAATDTSVPEDWDVSNAGSIGTPNIVSIDWQVASQTDDVSFGFCITDISIN